MRLHAKPYAALERPYPCGLGDLDALDAHASNGKVLVGRRNSVGSHLEVVLDGVEHSMKIDIEYAEEGHALAVQNPDGVLDHRLGDTVYLKEQIVFRITRL